MSDILKEPMFYRTLGALAQSLGKSNSYGAKAGAYGQAASEEWAARRAQEEAEKERKKKEKSGIFGDIGSVVGGVAGAVIPGVGAAVGPLIGSAVGNVAGQAAGGGGVDYTKTATSALQQAPSLISPDRRQTFDTETAKSSPMDRAGDYLHNAWGGPQGLTDFAASAQSRNAVPLSETLEMYPGQTEQSFLAQKQSARADDALTAQKQSSAADAAYRAQQAGVAAKRLDLDERRYNLEEKRLSKPEAYERINVQGGRERVMVDPFTGAEQLAVPLEPPKQDIRQESGGFRAVNPYTGAYNVVEAPLPQQPQQPKFGVSNVGGALVPWRQEPTGQAQVGEPLYTAPQKPQSPIIREGSYTNESGQVVSGPMQFDPTTNTMRPVAGTTGVPQAGSYQRPADVARAAAESIIKPWENLFMSGAASGPEDAKKWMEAKDAASKVEVQVQEIASENGGIAPSVAANVTPDTPVGYVRIGFRVPGVQGVIGDTENPIYIPIPPNEDVNSFKFKIEQLRQSAGVP